MMSSYYIDYGMAWCNADRASADYRQISNISRTKSQNLNVSRLVFVFAQSIEVMC